jgi:hypothetical protein
MQREQYRQWQKSVDLTAGSVLWLKYARLIPMDLKPENVSGFSEVSDALASPSKRWMAIKAAADTPAIVLADLSREDTKRTTLSLPESAYTVPQEGKAHYFSLVKWDTSSRYLLVKHLYNDDQSEWLVVDTEDGKATKNLTKDLGETFERPVFSNSDSRVLYAMIGNTIRRLDTASMTISGPLAKNVDSFDLTGDDVIVYSTIHNKDTNKRSVGYITKGASKAKILRSYDSTEATSLRATLGTYFGDAFIAVVHNETLEIMEGDLPRSDESQAPVLKEVVSSSVPNGASHLSTHTNGRFIIVSQESVFTVYDLELKKLTTTEISGEASGSDSIPRWLDGYTLWSDRGGSVRLYEFDGANQNTIMPVVSGMDVTLSPNEKYMYGIAKDGDKFYLTRVRLILS